MTVIAPFVNSGGRVEPYVSLDEVKFSATASAIDFTNLIENGSAAVQDRALSEIIVRASAKADQYTMGLYGSLNATTNTENGRYRPNRMGQLVIHPYFSPILELTAFSTGWGPGTNMMAITLSPQIVSIERDQFIITSNNPSGTYYGNLGIAGGMWNNTNQMFCEWTYINGWANSFTTATSAAGDTSLDLLDATGIYPGMFLTVWDGQNDEYIQVDSSYVVGNTTIPLVSPLRYKHGNGCNVSALPATVKQAVIHFVVAMIKQRGEGGLVLSEVGEPVAVSSRVQSSAEDEVRAYDLLDEFKQFWGRS